MPRWPSSSSTAGSSARQGRALLAQRWPSGDPRDVIDAALDELPDDEADRALEFARRRLGRCEISTAMCFGAYPTTARRGYGSTALSAARQALDERTAGAPRTGRDCSLRGAATGAFPRG
jgi:regulatory protein